MLLWNWIFIFLVFETLNFRSPQNGSAFFPGRNAQLVAEAVSVMIDGEKMIAALRGALVALGETPASLEIPPRPATVEKHSALRAYVFPIVVGGAVVAVMTLTLLAMFGGDDVDAGGS